MLFRSLGQFYMAKQREQKLQQQSYLQAVYETGARMTHDVKNLLQSLNVLCGAAEQEAGGSDELQALMRRQLPVITQRMQQTLDKLRRPVIDDGRTVAARTWWQGLERSYAGQNIEFRAGEIGGEALLPRELFDSAGDNLIQNAVNKRKLRGNIAISVSLDCTDAVRLEVCDGGHAVAADTARELLRGPVSSDSGLGIGLYQVARQAEASGFALALARNEDGRVSFVLSGALRPAGEPPAAAAA